MKNREFAEMFREMAFMYELEEEKWKPRAYRNAANGIENTSENVKEIYRKQGLKGLKEISGVGEAIADHIKEFFENGKIKKYEKLRKKYPESITKLVELEGLGPKKVKDLMKKLNISSPEDLKKAIQKNKIAELKGYGKKSQENISQALQFQEKSEKRMLQDQAFRVAYEVVDFLKNNCNIERIDYAGSLRRMKETIGDLDILTIKSKKPTGKNKKKGDKEIMEKFVKMPDVKKVVSKGSTRSTIILKEDDIHVDLRVLSKESYAAALIYFTGNKQHSIRLRKEAINKGYKLSEYGLFEKIKKENKKNYKKIPLKNEKSLYNKLGFQYIPPELRENTGELEIAKKSNKTSKKKEKIPNLIKVEDIKGDLQMHTTYSDGLAKVEEMAKKAKALGYSYIAITDHSKSQRIASGLEEKEIKKLWKEIDNINKRLKEIKILKGTEVDILKDGSLDYPNSILKKADVVVASVHSGFKMSKKEMTERVCKALRNKYVNILAHPTGRVLGKREGFNIDLGKVCKEAEANNVALEINADPNRLDLQGRKIKEVKSAFPKLKISVNTDAHSLKDLENMKYGIGQARKGWLEKKDVINTWSYSKLKEFSKINE